MLYQIYMGGSPAMPRHAGLAGGRHFFFLEPRLSGLRPDPMAPVCYGARTPPEARDTIYRLLVKTE